MIYCVEDDNSIRDLIIYTLQTSGFEAKGFAESGSFRRALAEELPELIMLDIMLPGEDGIEILKSIRANSITADIPVIMTTARGSEYDKVIGLDSGADDYLAKPFGMMEMVSRVKAVLRRSAPKEKTPVLSNGPICVDRSKHTVFSGENNIQLTLKEYELLCLFLENPGIVFSREQLLSSVWGTDSAIETRTVDVHIGTLRTKLGENGGCIGTVRGVGYRFEGIPEEES